MSAVAATLLIGAGTYAYFSDIGTSSANIFTAGTLNLQLDDNNETSPVENVSVSFGAGTLSPGNSVGGFVSFHNGGSVDIAEIKMGANQTANNNLGSGDLADVLDLTVKTADNSTCTTGDVDHTSTIAAAIGNFSGPLTLTELNNTDYDSLPGVVVGADKYLCITFTMQTDAGDVYQGDSITEDFVFEAHQHASQI